jgi:hypothetical protein
MPQLPLSSADVEGYLGVSAGPNEAQWLADAAAAASAFAARHGAGVVLDPLVPVEVSADVRLGAVMLAGRWFQRRNSITGVASFGDFGPAYVKSTDPDVAMLLGLYRPGVA